jgi:O-antigen/teichoic acid export membrane protein
MSLLRKLAGETAIYGLSYILSRILHYVLFTWYLTRVFNDEPSQYGIYRDFYFYVAIVLVILTFRMETTYFRFARENKAGVTMMSMSFLAGLAGIFLAVLYVFRDVVATWMEYPGMTRHLMVLGGVLFFDVLCAVPFASLRQANRPWRFLGLKLGSILLNIVLVLFFLELMPGLTGAGGWLARLDASGDKLFFVFLANMIASLVTFLLLIPLMVRQPFKWDPPLLRKMLAYSWPLVLVAIAGVIDQSSAIAFQKYLLPYDLTRNLAEGGIYSAAASLALLLNLFTVAFNYAAEPFFFAHQHREDARRVYADVALAFTLVGTLMMLVILAYIDVVQLLLGRNFRQGLHVVPVLLLSYLLLGIYYNVSTWYKLADKTLMGAWIALTGALITIAGNIVLIPLIGVAGSAWAALACYLFMTVAAIWQGRVHYPIPYPVVRMSAWIAGALGLFGVMQVLRPVFGENLIGIIAVNTLLIILYLLAVWRFERELLRQIMRRS